MNTNESFFKSMPWSWKEFAIIFTFIALVVPIFVEYIIGGFLQQFFQNDLYALMLMGIIMSIVFMVTLYLVTMRPFHLSWKELGLTSFPKKYWGAITGWLIVLLIGSTIILEIMMMFGGTYENNKTEGIQANLAFFPFLLAFITACIISPIYEEILYRGFLYRWIRTKYGVKTGIIISSTTFMLIHIPTYNTLPVNFLTGLVFAWTYEKTKSIVPAIILHAAFNMIAIVLTALA
jgi:uncharacterized protein